MSSNVVYKAETEKLKGLLLLRQIPYVEVDGADPVNKDLRNAMFRLSGRRAVYPQVFMRPKDADASDASVLEFVGGFAEVESANEREADDGSLHSMFEKAGYSGAEGDGGVGDAVSEAEKRRVSMAPDAHPDAWEELKDESGRVYFHNAHSNRTTWTRPPALGGVDIKGWQRFRDADGTTYWHDPSADTTMWSVPQPVRDAVLGSSEYLEDLGDWQEFKDEEGDPYYRNDKLGVTQWEKPELWDEWCEAIDNILK